MKQRRLNEISSGPRNGGRKYFLRSGSAIFSNRHQRTVCCGITVYRTERGFYSSKFVEQWDIVSFRIVITHASGLQWVTSFGATGLDMQMQFLSPGKPVGFAFVYRRLINKRG